MTSNPYRPPSSDIGPPPLRLFTALTVGVHFFIFPFLGVALAIVNYRRLTDARGMWRTAASFGGVSLAMLGFSLATRTLAQAGLLWLVRAILTVALFRDQRRLVHDHFVQGGAKARWWLASFAVFLPTVVVLLAIWQFLAPGTRTHP